LQEDIDVWVMAFDDTGEEATAAVAKRFGIVPEAAAQLMATTPVRVKREVSEETGERFREVLVELGARVEIVATGEQPIVTDGIELEDVSPRATEHASAAEPGPARPRVVVGTPIRHSLPAPLPSSHPPPEPAKREPFPFLKVGIGVSILLLPLVGLFFIVPDLPSLGGPEEPADVDSICEAELTTRLGHMEARRFLTRGGTYLMGLSDPSQALGVVNALYQAGSPNVEVTSIERSGPQQFADTIVAEIPDGQGDAIEAAAERGLGRSNPNAVEIAPGAVVERGERYLRITFGNGPAGAPVEPMNDYELERELRESSRASERGFRPNQ